MSRHRKEIPIQVSYSENSQIRTFLAKRVAEAQADLVHQYLQASSLSEVDKRTVLDQLMEEMKKDIKKDINEVAENI